MPPSRTMRKDTESIWQALIYISCNWVGNSLLGKEGLKLSSNSSKYRKKAPNKSTNKHKVPREPSISMAVFPVSLLADQSLPTFIISPREQNVHTAVSDLQRLQETEADQETVLECSLPCLCWVFLQRQGILGGTTPLAYDMDWLTVHFLEELGLQIVMEKKFPDF